MDALETKLELLSLLYGHSYDSEVIQLSHLKAADTASDVAGYVSNNFYSLYNVLGVALCDFVRNSFSKEIWESQHVLINPQRVFNEDTGIADYIVVADGSERTLQYEGTRASYYGNVKLWINGGAATVMDSSYEVKAAGTSSVKAGGYTKVYAAHMDKLELFGHAKATVTSAKMIIARENSFVESIGGTPQITAMDKAQYLISGGSPSIVHKDGARGVIDEAVPHLLMDCCGDGAIFFGEKSKYYQVACTGNNLFMITGYGPDEIKDRYLEAIIPRYQGNKEPQIACIAEPLPVEQLAADLRPFLRPADSLQPDTIKFHCADEMDVCRLISEHIPVLADRGLNADFLRTHFTYETLVRSNIHVDEDTYHPYRPVTDGCQYVFGKAFVNALGHKQPIMGYEQSLVVANLSPRVEVTHQATAFGFGSSEIAALDHAKAYVGGKSQLYANKNAYVAAYNECSVMARDNAQVRAFDKTTVEGHDHNYMALYHDAKASVDDRCRVVCLGSNEVKATGDARVAKLTIARYSNPSLTEDSTVKDITRLESMWEYETFQKAWMMDCITEPQQSSGVKR